MGHCFNSASVPSQTPQNLDHSDWIFSKSDRWLPACTEPRKVMKGQILALLHYGMPSYRLITSDPCSGDWVFIPTPQCGG